MFELMDEIVVFVGRNDDDSEPNPIMHNVDQLEGLPADGEGGDDDEWMEGQ